MKVSDFVVDYLVGKGIKTVYGVSGGGIMHLCDSLIRRSDIEFVPCMSEYGAGYMACADAHYRLSPSVCMITSGPGSTNAVTAVATAWVEGLPVLFIAGQVNTFWKARNERSRGGQEVKMIPIIDTITKFHVEAIAHNIDVCLDMAFDSMLSGRWGPAWIEIPLNMQQGEIANET